MGLGGARKGWRRGRRGRAQGTGDAPCCRGRGAPLPEKRHTTAGAHLVMAGPPRTCRSAGWPVSPVPMGSLPPAEDCLGFLLQVAKRQQSSRREGREEASSRSRRWPSAGPGVLEGRSLSSCCLGEAGGLEGARKAGPRKRIPLGQDTGQRVPGGGWGKESCPLPSFAGARFFRRESPKRLITSQRLPLPGLWSARAGCLLVLHGHTPLRPGTAPGTRPLCGPVALAPSLCVLLESKHCPKNQRDLLYKLG